MLCDDPVTQHGRQRRSRSPERRVGSPLDLSIQGKGGRTLSVSRSCSSFSPSRTSCSRALIPCSRSCISFSPYCTSCSSSCIPCSCVLISFSPSRTSCSRSCVPCSRALIPCSCSCILFSRSCTSCSGVLIPSSPAFVPRSRLYSQRSRVSVPTPSWNTGLGTTLPASTNARATSTTRLGASSAQHRQGTDG